MGSKQELISCYTDKKGSVKEIISKYAKKLKGKEEKGLFEATMRLLSANCAAPGVSPNRKLDLLTKNNKDYQTLKVLIREYGKGMVEIVDAFDAYFELNEPREFWEFFNRTLGLPEDWH